MTNLIISPATAKLNLSESMFHKYARQYLECRKSFTVESSSPVPYFLLSRAIELELKARLLSFKTRAELKKHGHNLKKLYDLLLIEEKILNKFEYEELVKASEIYDIPNKGFEYVSVYDAMTRLESFPDLLILNNIAEKLICNT